MKALLENPVVVAKKVQKAQIAANEPDKPVPTAMEMALRQAMERSKTDEEEATVQSSKKEAAQDQELEGILARTLEHKVKTGS